MKSKRMVLAWAALSFGGAIGVSRAALADEPHATLGAASVGEFAEPPDGRTSPIVVDQGRYDHEPFETPVEPRSSSVRLELGPRAVTSGKGLGAGVGVAAAFGRGSVGGRLSAIFARGETGDETAQQTARLGSGLSQYAGELTVDLLHRGPIHPIIGIGLGLAHVSRPQGGGVAGVGLGRLALEYSLGLDDADVRIGLGATGALTGPKDTELNGLPGYVLVGASVGIGF